MTSPLSPEAVAQEPEWPAHVDCKVECWFSPTLRAIAAENARLRADNARLIGNARAQGILDDIGAAGQSHARQARKLSKRIGDQRAEMKRLWVSEAAALERVKVLEGAAHRLLSATQCFDHPDTPKSVADAYVAHMARPEELLRAALTPTADKEPK